jgi:hypothetical protein
MAEKVIVYDTKNLIAYYTSFTVDARFMHLDAASRVLVNHTIAALTNLKKYEDNKPTEINK